MKDFLVLCATLKRTATERRQNQSERDGIEKNVEKVKKALRLIDNEVLWI